MTGLKQVDVGALVGAMVLHWLTHKSHHYT